MKYREIAQHLGISVSSVEKYMMQAIKHVAKRLGGTHERRQPVRDGFHAGELDQAAEWFARLQSEDSGSATKRRFRCWLRQSPDNVSAFRECQSMWE